MTEPHKLTDLVPVEVLTEVNTAVAVELVKRELGIERGWEAAYQLVSTFDLPSMQPTADVTADGP